MIATFTPAEDTRATILQPAVGHVLTVKLPSGNRVVLIVSDADREKLGTSRNITKVLTVTDLMTGMEHQITGDACGLGCRCAVRFA